MPAEYSNACPARFKAKMAFDCESQSYVVVKYPIAEQLPVDVNVALRTRINRADKSECFYRVTLSRPGEEGFSVDLELTELGTEIEYEADNGTYLVTIGGKVGVCFPLAEAQCSPCYIYTCIPEKLLVSFEVTRHSPCTRPGQIIYILMDWDETYYHGTVDVGEDTVEAVAVPLATQCGFRVTLEGIPEGGAVEPFDILLEGPVDPDSIPCDGYTRVTNKLEIADNVFALTNRGTSGCNGSIRTSLMYQEFTIRDYEGAQMGSGSIRDGDCVVARVAAEFRACCLNMETLCPYTGHLHLGVIAPTCSGGLDGFATVLTNGASSGLPNSSCFTDGQSLLWTLWNSGSSPAVQVIQCGPTELCLPLRIEFYLACCYPPFPCDEVAPEDPARYRLWLRRGSFDPAPVEAALTYFSCDPFLLEFEADALWTQGGCDCCPEGGTMTIRVTK